MDNTNKYIVTTTINSPTEATLKFCEKKNWNFIIVGDLKTPHNEYFALEKKYRNVYYMHPDMQDKMYTALSAAIGWNKIMRRDLGFCEAYRLGADIIATVDDDNLPYENWGENIYNEILQFVNDTEPTSVVLSLFSPYPGSPMSMYPEKYGIRLLNHEYKQLRNYSGRLDKEENAEMLYEYMENSPWGKPLKNETILKYYADLQTIFRERGLNF